MEADTGIDENSFLLEPLMPRRAPPDPLHPALALIFLIHHHVSSSFISTSFSILIIVQCLVSVPIPVCPSILYVCGVLCVCVCVLACVVARIDRLMPKRKFPEFCEGLRKRAGIKIVCVCGELCWLQWWGRMIAFWKKRDREGRAWTLSLFQPYPWSLL